MAQSLKSDGAVARIIGRELGAGTQEQTKILAARTNAAKDGLGDDQAGAVREQQPRPAGRPDSRSAIESTVTGLGYELVEVERALRGLLRVTIDRVPGKTYPSGDSEFITVDDCELVTRQLQYALQVDGVAYERLEVSSPGLDRPLKTTAHFERFAGLLVNVTLKQPFQGRKAFKGLLGRADSGWTLLLDDGKGEQVLGFALDEVREARLVPVVDFKGRKGNKGIGTNSDAAGSAADNKAEGPATAAARPALDGGQDR